MLSVLRAAATRTSTWITCEPALLVKGEPRCNGLSWIIMREAARTCAHDPPRSTADRSGASRRRPVASPAFGTSQNGGSFQPVQQLSGCRPDRATLQLGGRECSSTKQLIQQRAPIIFGLSARRAVPRGDGLIAFGPEPEMRGVLSIEQSSQGGHAAQR